MFKIYIILHYNIGTYALLTTLVRSFINRTAVYYRAVYLKSDNNTTKIFQFVLVITRHTKMYKTAQRKILSKHYKILLYTYI